MDNNITIFENNQFGQVRTVSINDEAWFVAKDICDCLKHSNSRVAISRLDEDEKGVSKVYTLGGNQEMQIISESGVYNLVFTSILPEARQFKRWITHDVIPSIRKHGIYATNDTVDQMLNDPDSMIRALQALKTERTARIQLENQMLIDKPKTLFADAVAGSQTSILIGELAKLIAQNGVDVGQNRLFIWLRKNGYLMQGGSSYNTPTQRSIELGVLEIKERTIMSPDGRSMAVGTPYVTGKGQVYFMEKLLKLKEEGLI